MLWDMLWDAMGCYGMLWNAMGGSPAVMFCKGFYSAYKNAKLDQIRWAFPSILDDPY